MIKRYVKFTFYYVNTNFKTCARICNISYITFIMSIMCDDTCRKKLFVNNNIAFSDNLILFLSGDE